MDSIDRRFLVAGGMWTTEDVDCVSPVPAGARVQIVAVDGLKLKVRRVVEDPLKPE